MAGKTIQVPFFLNEQLNYPDKLNRFKRLPEDWSITQYRSQDIEWKPNQEFTATMKYVGYSRGKSSVSMHMEDEAGTTYSMFISDFEVIIPLMALGVIRAKWTFCKKGQNYGLKLVK
jgi:hypothetical protein